MKLLDFLRRRAALPQYTSGIILVAFYSNRDAEEIMSGPLGRSALSSEAMQPI